MTRELANFRPYSIARMVDLNDTDRAKLVSDNQGTSENPVAPLLNDSAQRVDFSKNKCNDA